MEKKLQTLYGLNDITIIPEKLTDIRSRKQCFPHYIQEDVYDGNPLHQAALGVGYSVHQ